MFASIKEDIQVVFERDPAARSALETLLACPGLHAIVLHRLNHWLWNKNLYLPARLCAHLVRFVTGVEIHPAASIGRRLFIDHGMGIVIGETAEIGDDCSLYHGVTLGGTSWSKGKRHPRLAHGVIVGAGAKILGPVTLGQNSRVGSNAVVVKDVPAGATVVGIPGHVVASRGEALSDKDVQREAMAKKIGFAAYGTSKDMPDPMQHAVDTMLDHLHALDEEVARLKRKIDDSDR